MTARLGPMTTDSATGCIGNPMTEHRLVGVAWCVLYLAIRLVLGLVHESHGFWDSVDYFAISAESVGEILFGGSERGPDSTDLRWRAAGIYEPVLDRPPLVPLLYKVLAQNDIAIRAAQSLLGGAAWLALAFAVASKLGGAGRVVALVAIPVVGLSSAVQMWDSLWLAESVSLSFFVLTIAAALVASSASSTRRLLFLAAVAGAFGLTRDLNAFLVGGAGGIAALWMFVSNWRAWRRALLVGATAFVILAVSMVSATAGRREEVPMYNILGLRILPSTAGRAFYLEQGMPFPEAARSMVGRRGQEGWTRVAELESVRDWVKESGRRAYLAWLLSRPWAAAVDPARDLSELLARQVAYEPEGYEPPLGVLDRILVPQRTGHLTAILAVTLAAIVNAVRRQQRAVAVLTGALLVLALAIIELSWHGDAIEFGRHAASAVPMVMTAGAVGLSSIVDTLPRNGKRRHMTNITSRPSARRATPSDDAAERCAGARVRWFHPRRLRAHGW